MKSVTQQIRLAVAELLLLGGARIERPQTLLATEPASVIDHNVSRICQWSDNRVKVDFVSGQVSLAACFAQGIQLTCLLTGSTRHDSRSDMCQACFLRA